MCIVQGMKVTCYFVIAIWLCIMLVISSTRTPGISDYFNFHACLFLATGQSWKNCTRTKRLPLRRTTCTPTEFGRRKLNPLYKIVTMTGKFMLDLGYFICFKYVKHHVKKTYEIEFCMELYFLNIPSSSVKSSVNRFVCIRIMLG